MIYDEKGNAIENPDLEKGYLYERHLLDGSVRNIYHKFTVDELAEMEKMNAQPTQEQRITQLEEENKQLKEALDLLLSGATEEEVTVDG